MLDLDPKDLPAIFPLLGLFLTLYHVWGVLDFVWFHYLRPKSYTRLLHGNEPYALVTGATDGIGRSTAMALYAKGFNLILHGRNEGKMKQVVEKVKAANPESGLDIKYFVADASLPDLDFKGIARRFADLNITLFVNNVGGSSVTNQLIDQVDEDLITNVLNINAWFPFFLTRAFLPSLRRTSQSGPVEVVYIGSFAGDVAAPFVAPYAGSKALIKRVSSILHAEERILSSSNLSFVYANVGEVQTGTMTAATAFARPHADDYARHLVESFGSGRRLVIPYPVHHVVYAIVTGMPGPLCDYIVLTEGKNVFEKIKGNKKRR